MITLNPDFKEFLQLLNAHDVEWLLVGGYAVALHGYVRFTSDIDIWINTTPENVSKVIGVLVEFGLPDAPQLFEVLQKEMRVIGMGIPPYKIEIITTIDGVFFSECYQSRETIDIDEVKIDFISLPYLLQNKKASGRFKDLNDLEHLSDKT